eukprot:COSAG01_NODE_11057_length_2018_cov_2.068265_2_plen_186_part_00
MSRGDGAPPRPAQLITTPHPTDTSAPRTRSPCSHSSGRSGPCFVAGPCPVSLVYSSPPPPHGPRATPVNHRQPAAGDQYLGWISPTHLVKICAQLQRGLVVWRLLVRRVLHAVVECEAHVRLHTTTTASSSARSSAHRMNAHGASSTKMRQDRGRAAAPPAQGGRPCCSRPAEASRRPSSGPLAA